MAASTVTGPGVERRVDSPEIGLSLAITLANQATRAGLDSSFYVRDPEGTATGRTDPDGEGGVTIWRAS